MNKRKVQKEVKAEVEIDGFLRGKRTSKNRKRKIKMQVNGIARDYASSTISKNWLLSFVSLGKERFNTR